VTAYWVKPPALALETEPRHPIGASEAGVDGRTPKPNATPP